MSNGETITLIDPQGSAVDVSSDIAPELLAEGYTAETSEARAGRALEAELEEAYGDRPVTAAALGAARALTFGGTDVAARALGKREAVQQIRERAPIASGIGEIGGDVAAALATGGTSLARKLPGAVVAGAAERVAARAAGKPLRNRVALSALGYGAEGAAHGAGAWVSQQALAADPNFSGEALISSVGLGALLGGGAGAVVTLGKGAASAARVRRAKQVVETGASPETLLRQLDELTPEDLARMARETVPDVEKAIGFRALIPRSERSAARVGERATTVVRQVDESAATLSKARRDARALFRETPETAPALATEAGEMARAEVGAAIEGYAAAQRAAKKWQRGWLKELGPDDLGRGKLPTLSDDAAERAVMVLGDLDDAAETLAGAMERARVLVPTPAASLAPSSPTTLQALGQRAQDVGGMLALAQDAGLPVPDVDAIPGIGPVLGAYLKFRTARNALAKVGVVRRSPATRSASQVVDARNRITDSVQRLTQPTARVARGAALPAAARALTPEDTRSRIEDLTATGPEEIAQLARAETSHLDPAVQEAAVASAQRQLAYLQRVAPKPPASGTYFGAAWSPTPLQTAQFRAQLQAVEQPLEAIAAMLTASYQQYDSVMAMAIEETHPAIWAQVRAELVAGIDDIVKNTPYQRRDRLGALFGVPLTGRQLPEYAGLTAALTPERPPEQPDLGAPTATPKSATFALTSMERKLARRS